MKRLIGIFALLFCFALLMTIPILKADANANDAPIQFKGYVTNYPGGSPAQDGTIVKAYLGGVLKGEVTLQLGTGYYALTGNPNVFTTGTYELRVDTGDRIGITTVYHTQDTETPADISLIPY